jgi:hypothetical protein
MEVDLVVTPELQPTKSKVVFGTMILSGVIDGFDEAKGTAPIFAFVLTEVTRFLVKPLIKHFLT